MYKVFIFPLMLVLIGCNTNEQKNSNRESEIKKIL